MVQNTVMDGIEYSCEWYRIQPWMIYNTAVNGIEYSCGWYRIQLWMVQNTSVDGIEYSYGWYRRVRTFNSHCRVHENILTIPSD